LLRRKGDFEGAVAEYSAALECDPGLFKAWFNRGFGEWGEEWVLGRARPPPSRPSPFPSRVASAKDKLKDFSGAISDYTRALDIDPKAGEREGGAHRGARRAAQRRRRAL